MCVELPLLVNVPRPRNALLLTKLCSLALLGVEIVALMAAAAVLGGIEVALRLPC